MTRRSSSRGLVVVITIVVIFLFVEGLLVAYVFISPSASDRLGGVAVWVQGTWDGHGDQAGIRTKVASAVDRGYQDWIAPLWAEPQEPSGDPEFKDCVGCHQDYAATTKFNVYMDHPLHAQVGVECATCHMENVHPNPPRPLEKTCAECHDQVDRKDECSFCHPPASLPHFYLLGASKDAVVNCDVCHPKASFLDTHPTPKVDVGALDGTDRGLCLSCHEEPACRQCHALPHPSNWVTVHGQNLFGGNVAACYTCHVSTWCSDRCHAVTSTVPIGLRPIPPVGVRP